MALVQDICLTTKKCVCREKDSKNTSKSINQIRPVGEGVKSDCFLPPKTSHKLGTDVKRGKQVGFLIISSVLLHNWWFNKTEMSELANCFPATGQKPEV